tara:strand:- start:3 stop:572 length:570 start_codon:yes stop_codon:yes gene_type:complete
MVNSSSGLYDISFGQQLNKAQNSAAQARPKAYVILDQLAQFYDQLSNSSSLSPDSAMTETKHLELADMLNNGALKGVETKIAGILTAGIIQKQFGGAGNAITAKAQQQAQQEQVKGILEGFQQVMEQRMKFLARIMYENSLADEQSKQLNKLAGSDMASASGYSEEKINAMDDISYTQVMDPEDLELNA